jgi:hypothetical protein
MLKAFIIFMLSVSTLLLREQKILSPNPHALKNTNGRAPPTDYFNMYGDKVRHIDDGKNEKIFVLTWSDKQNKIDAAIHSGDTLSVPTSELLDKMLKAYETTDSDSKEQYIAVGKRGMSSVIIEGSADEVNDKQTLQARKYLDSLGDHFAYSIHSHPNQRDSYGNLMHTGAPTPSTKDKTSDRLGVPEVILGYQQKKPFPDPNTVLNGTQQVNLTRCIGFFDSSGTILNMDFSRFTEAVKKINKQH